MKTNYSFFNFFRSRHTFLGVEGKKVDVPYNKSILYFIEGVLIKMINLSHGMLNIKTINFIHTYFNMGWAWAVRHRRVLLKNCSTINFLSKPTAIRGFKIFSKVLITAVHR